MLRTTPVYLADGAPDADAVRRAVAAFGVGKKIEVSTTASKRVRGRIRSIEAGGFSVVGGGALRVTEQIEYGAVTELKGVGMDRSTIAWVAAGVALTVIVLFARPWVPS